MSNENLSERNNPQIGPSDVESNPANPRPQVDGFAAENLYVLKNASQQKPTAPAIQLADASTGSTGISIPSGELPVPQRFMHPTVAPAQQPNVPSGELPVPQRFMHPPAPPQPAVPGPLSAAFKSLQKWSAHQLTAEEQASFDNALGAQAAGFGGAFTADPEVLKDPSVQKGLAIDTGLALGGAAAGIAFEAGVPLATIGSAGLRAFRWGRTAERIVEMNEQPPSTSPPPRLAGPSTEAGTASPARPEPDLVNSPRERLDLGDPQVDPTARISDDVQLGRGVHIGKGSRVNGSVIGDGTHIGNFSSINDSSIGSGTIIGDNVTIMSSAQIGEVSIPTIIGDGVEIGDSLHIQSLDIGDGAKIGLDPSARPISPLDAAYGRLPEQIELGKWSMDPHLRVPSNSIVPRSVLPDGLPLE
jgi:hypothetical protein